MATSGEEGLVTWTSYNPASFPGSPVLEWESLGTRLDGNMNIIVQSHALMETPYSEMVKMIVTMREFTTPIHPSITLVSFPVLHHS